MNNPERFTISSNIFEEEKSQKEILDIQIIEKGKEIIKNAPQTYISVDIEADGVAGFGSMLSIGAVAPSGEKFYSEICPAYENYIDSYKEFNEKHGLDREQLKESAPDDFTVMQEFAAWVENVVKNNDDKKPVFTAFNAGFDWAFVDLYFKKNNIENPFGIAPFDLKSLALALNNDFDWEKTKKHNLPQEITPDEEFTHNALDDAEYQQILMYGLVALNKEKQN